MLFTLAQVIGVLAIIGSVPEAQMEQRAALVIAFGNKLSTDMRNKLCNFLWGGRGRRIAKILIAQ